MKKLLFLLFLSLGLFIGCSDETDFVLDEEKQPNLLESRTTSGSIKSVVPLEIVEEIATKYPIVKGDLFVDNSETSIQREVREFHTLPDKEGIPALYVITYKDDLGYLVVSAD